jgi:hypothetical protein
MAIVDWYLPLILLCAISRAAVQLDQRLVLKTREEIWWLTSNHVRGHAIANEQDQVPGLPRWRNVANEPIGHGGGAIVVAQCRSVLSWLGENYIPICFAGDLDQRRCLSVLGKSIYFCQPCMANNPRSSPSPSNQVKFQVSSFGSDTPKKLVALRALPPGVLMAKVKLESGVDVRTASLPLTGACTSRRISNR